MDFKIGLIEKLLAQKKQSFGHTSVIIVDANGNILLNESEGRKDVVLEECKVIKETNAEENNKLEKEKYGVVEDKLFVSEELKTDNDSMNEIYHVSKEDTLTISAWLDGKRSQIFTAKLNKSNYICFIDGKGILICRGNFNVSEHANAMGLVNVKKALAAHVSKLKGRLNQPTPLLAASKVSGVLTAVTGDSNSKYSMVETVKEISELLED